MSLTLSTREHALLVDALLVVASPSTFAGTGEWSAAVCRALEPLLGAEGPAVAHRLVAAARAPAAGLLVRVEAPRAPSDVELRARFALTTREIEVVRLLAVGRSAREVAAALGLSYYTARHHVEHVLGKLGVRTRAAVASATAAAPRR